MNRRAPDEETRLTPGEAGLIVGFHTTDSVYSWEARRLKASADRLGLAISLTPVESAGGWVENCSRKASFLFEQRQALRGRLLYVDVDAVIHSDPWRHLTAFDEDIALCFSRDGKLRSGTIVLNDTPGCRKLLEDWTKRAAAFPHLWDQVLLQQIVEEREGANLQVRRLPQKFCLILDEQRDGFRGEPVIEHLQASREWRGARRSIWRLWRRSKRSEGLLKSRLDRVAAVEAELGLRRPTGG